MSDPVLQINTAAYEVSRAGVHASAYEWISRDDDGNLKPATFDISTQRTLAIAALDTAIEQLQKARRTLAIVSAHGKNTKRIEDAEGVA